MIIIQQQLQQPGAVAWSEILKKACDVAEVQAEDRTDGLELVGTYKILDQFGIPVQTYKFREDPHWLVDWPLLPDGVEQECPTGCILAMRGSLYVVVENAEDHMYLTPVEYIDITK